MKSFRNSHRLSMLLVAAIILWAGIAARADLDGMIQFIEAHSKAEAAFFRAMWFPDGKAVEGLRPPSEVRPELEKVAATAPNDPEIAMLQAMEDEKQLDFSAAEAHWKKYAAITRDRGDGFTKLADFYDRRLRPEDEIAALNEVAKSPASASEKLLTATEQRPWQAFVRIFDVGWAHGLPARLGDEEYRAWIARYPAEAYVYVRYFEFLLATRDFSGAQRFLAEYQKAFPQDNVFPVKGRALIAYKQGSVEQGLAEYDRNFQALWPPELVQNYFELLRSTRSVRKFQDQARAGIAAHPDDVNTAARLYYFYQQDGKQDAAQSVLAELRSRREARHTPWTASELYTMAKLAEGVHDYDEAARYYYAMYNVQGGDANTPARALAGLIDLLLTAPEQPIRIGADDLSMYSDIATLDRGPGYLNGILSLIFNSNSPRQELSNQENAAVPYFHRGKASVLLHLLDQRVSNAPERAALHVKLLDAYDRYGETDVLIREAREFLTAFPNSSDRVHVSLMLADGLARKNQTDEEFATYDALLKELAAKADGVPLGAKYANQGEQQYFNQFNARGPENQQNQCNPNPTPPANSDGGTEADSDEGGGEAQGDIDSQPAPGSAAATDCNTLAGQRKAAEANAFGVTAQQAAVSSGPRSPEYARILDRYISRLVVMKRPVQALALYRQEIERNPDDPGLYERLAQFLDSNKLGSDLEATYKKAIDHFQDPTWHHKLARWYLREKRVSDFEELTQQIVKTFAGTDLERYMRSVVGYGFYFGPNSEAMSAQLYLRVNLYAHQRFPHDLTFTRNLLRAYRSLYTRDEAAWIELARQNWMYADDLRAWYFQTLSNNGSLAAMLQAARGKSEAAPNGKTEELIAASPAAAQFVAEAEAWGSHFEAAAPVFKQLAAVYPGDPDLDRRASTVLRSLAPFKESYREDAAAIEVKLAQLMPTDRNTLARIGDIYADKELYEKAAPYWDRMAELTPGNPDGYLESATVYWDYYLFDDALRQIEAGRQRLHSPTLYSFEEGTIYEGKRDFPRAIEQYMNGALSGAGDVNDTSCYGICLQSEYIVLRPRNPALARQRLLDLAVRPAHKQQVEEATTARVSGNDPSLEAVQLRIDILLAQNRRDDLERFLSSLVERTSNFELLDSMQNVAQAQKMQKVRERALEKQASLTADPVERTRLRLDLVKIYESNKENEAATRVLEELYKEQPNILGIVRSLVDFYWRNKMQAQALGVLGRAIQIAQPPYKDRFLYEAATKSIETGQYAEARKMLSDLLSRSPYDSSTISAMADSYSRQGDDKGLREFYLAEIKLFRDAKELSDDTRKQQIATLRRALIPALTRLQDYAGAIDQYIEIVNRFPEDAQVTSEAAIYAVDHDRKAQLAEYYSKTAAASPKAYMWPLVQARIATAYEDFPAAIEAYGRAITVRPERTDLYTARAGLHERLMQFDEAVKDYEQLYDLTYKDQQWMLKVAEVRARQGKRDAVIAALRKAWIEDKPERAENEFEVARRLEGWDMLADARSYAERGVKEAGADLLINQQFAAGAMNYARIMTRLRAQEEAFTVLLAARRSGRAQPVSVDDSNLVDANAKEQLRRRAEEQRNQSIENNLTNCARMIAQTVDQYATPEERLAFAMFLIRQRANVSRADLERIFVPMAEAAGLAELEALWRYQSAMADAQAHQATNQYYSPETGRLGDLQNARLQQQALGRQLENIAGLLSGPARASMLNQAATAYRQGESEENEYRLLSSVANHSTRYWELARRRNPEELIRQAGECTRQNEVTCRKVVQWAIENGTADLALRSVAASGHNFNVAWNRSYGALTGLFFARQLDAATQQTVNGNFTALLGPRTVGEQLTAKIDREQQLAGDLWFYYGGRYGEYLGTLKQGDPEDYLPAVLEGRPGFAQAYYDLGRYYEDAGNLDAALADFDHTLELDPNRASTHNRIARVLWRQNKKAEAIEHWKRSLQILNQQMRQTNVPESFWTNVQVVIGELRQRKLIQEMHDDVDKLLRGYVKKNGSYRSTPLLRAAYESAATPASGVEWVLDVSTAAENQFEMLINIVDARWIAQTQREPIYNRILELQRVNLGKAQAANLRDYERSTLRNWEMRWAGYLIDAGQYPRAQQVLEAFSESEQQEFQSQFVPLQVRLAVKMNTLDALLTGYRNDSKRMPPVETLRTAANDLAGSGNKDAAHQILELIYTQEIQQHNLNAANLLGLAEIRIEKNDLPGALALLRRMNLVVGAPFENLVPAADLLLKTGHPTEALEFLQQRTQAVPWDDAAKEKLAAAEAAGGKDPGAGAKALVEVAASRMAPYALRVLAAKDFAKLHGNDAVPFEAGSAELAILAKASIPEVTAVEKPYFYEARLQAAVSGTMNTETRLRVLRPAVEAFPYRDEARAPLFQALVESGHAQLAVSSVERMTSYGALQFVADSGEVRKAALSEEPEPNPTEAGDAGSDEPNEISVYIPSSQRGRNALLVAKSERGRYSGLLGQSLEKLDRDDEALTAYRQAIVFSQERAAKTQWRKSRNAVRERIDRRKANKSRAPVVTQDVTQSLPVRPMLVAHAAPVPKSAVVRTRPAQPAQRKKVAQ